MKSKSFVQFPTTPQFGWKALPFGCVSYRALGKRGRERAVLLIPNVPGEGGQDHSLKVDSETR